MRIGSIAAAIVLMATSSAYAQSQPAAAVSDRERAIDDSLRQLFDAVGHLRLTTGQPFGAVLARSATDEEEVRHAIVMKHQAWRAYRQSGGELEVDTWVPIGDLDAILARIVQERLKSKSLLQAVRISWARSNAPVILTTGRYLPAAGFRGAAAGWRNCSPRQVVMARKAAAVDARAALLSRISSCRMAGDTELGFLLQRYPSLQESLRNRLSSVPVGPPILEPIGICRVKAELTQPALLLLLQEAARATNGRVDADLLNPPDLSSIPATCSAEGFAVAPPVPSMYSPPRKQDCEPELPEWVDRFLVVQGGGRAPVDMQDEPSRHAWAERAARIEASRQIWLQIEDLPLPNGETVGARLSKDLNAATVLAGLDRFIATTGVPFEAEDGTTTVTMGIHLQIVWRMLSNLDQGR